MEFWGTQVSRPVILREDGGDGLAERLALVGDGLLKWLVAETLTLDRGLDEGQATTLLSKVVSNASLAQYAVATEFPCIQPSKEYSVHSLGTMVEAALALVKHEAGEVAARNVVKAILMWMESHDGVLSEDTTSKVSLWAAKHKMSFHKDVQRVGGEDHKPIFQAVVWVQDENGVAKFKAEGGAFPAKKEAVRDAAAGLWAQCSHIPDPEEAKRGAVGPVSLLNEMAMKLRFRVMKDVRRVGGPSHDPMFEASVWLEDNLGERSCYRTSEIWNSKKDAIRDASALTLEDLQTNLAIANGGVTS